MKRINVATLKRWARNPRVAVRVVLGALLAADLVTAALVFKPWSGSASGLQRQAAALRAEVKQRQGTVERLRGVVGKVEAARVDGDKFMDGYLLSRRTLASALVEELDQTARKSGIKQRDISYGFEPIEGSDTLSKVTITAGYEGTYGDLMHFLNLLDRSDRLLIIESLAAAPQQAGMTLAIQMKLNGFVREPAPAASSGAEPVQVAEGAAK